jgi:glycosyltransferase involved in cell wall biosynthesis
MGLATRISVERADRIAAFSHHTRTEIIRHLNVPEEKIVVIPHGIQERYLDRIDTPLIDAVKAKYGIAGEYILSINDIHPRKNIEGLNDAFLWLS